MANNMLRTNPQRWFCLRFVNKQFDIAMLHTIFVLKRKYMEIRQLKIASGNGIYEFNGMLYWTYFSHGTSHVIVRGKIHLSSSGRTTTGLINYMNCGWGEWRKKLKVSQRQNYANTNHSSKRWIINVLTCHKWQMRTLRMSVSSAR